MNYYKYIISDKKHETEDTYIFTVKPKASQVFAFKPGEYVLLRNPDFTEPDEAHPFSIASSPLQKDGLEFCVKNYGDWSTSFLQKEKGSTVYISEPQGSFTWDMDYPYVVFLLGGIGISPIMSMLRTIRQKNTPTEIVMLYGNRTPETIAYQKELKDLEQQLPRLKIVHIFSAIPADHQWKGYRGFITKEIIEKEVTLSKKPVFFYIGPPIFIEKMTTVLRNLNILDTAMNTESLSILKPKT